MADRVGRVEPLPQPGDRKLAIVSDELTTVRKPLSATEKLVRAAIDEGCKSWTEVADQVAPQLPTGRFSRQAARQTGERRGWVLSAKDPARETTVSFRTREASVKALDDLVKSLTGSAAEPGPYKLDRSDLIRLFIERGYQDLISGKRQVPGKFLRRQ